jgi:hypothetical protein
VIGNAWLVKHFGRFLGAVWRPFRSFCALWLPAARQRCKARILRTLGPANSEKRPLGATLRRVKRCADALRASLSGNFVLSSENAYSTSLLEAGGIDN